MGFHPNFDMRCFLFSLNFSCGVGFGVFFFFLYILVVNRETCVGDCFLDVIINRRYLNSVFKLIAGDYLKKE